MKPTSQRHQKGFTLIELMVSLVLSLGVMIALGQVYLGASTAGQSAEAQGRMNEDAQMALSILAQQIKLAGDNPAQPGRASASLYNPVTTTYVLRGCDLNFSNISTNPLTFDGLTCAHTSASAATGAGAIAVRYEASVYNTVPTALPNRIPTDCLGNSLPKLSAPYTTTFSAPDTADYYQAENAYYLGTSAAVKNSSLYCKGSSTNTPSPLVENIESLRFTFGVTTPADPEKVAGYLTAWQVENNADALAGLGINARWALVRTVRICVLARSADSIATSKAANQYLDCSGALVTASDTRLRRAYTTTVVLRNRVSPT